MESLLTKIRPVTEADRQTLKMASYTKLDTYKKCAMQYYYKYVEKKFSFESSLATELGSICHYVLEQKGKMLNSDGGKVDYERLSDYLINGVTELDEKTTQPLSGVNTLKKKYMEDWYSPDNASGKTYEDKMKIFDEVLHHEMETDDWMPILFEHPFEFVYDNRIIIHGYIDRIDKKVVDGETYYRTTDYKTSKKLYSSSDVATSLQFGIYALAILLEFGVLPIESLYRFILINDQQHALTKGWEKRLVKALDKLLNGIDQCGSSHIWKPSPTPLCAWCSYSKTNTGAQKYNNLCEYHSLWTPTNKTFEVNKSYEEKPIEEQTAKRKIVF